MKSETFESVNFLMNVLVLLRDSEVELDNIVSLTGLESLYEAESDFFGLTLDDLDYEKFEEIITEFPDKKLQLSLKALAAGFATELNFEFDVATIRGDIAGEFNIYQLKIEEFIVFKGVV